MSKENVRTYYIRDQRKVEVVKLKPIETLKQLNELQNSDDISKYIEKSTKNVDYRVTIVSNLIKLEDKYRVDFAWTLLNPIDKDDKNRFREIALSRLQSKSGRYFSTFEFTEQPKFLRISKTILESIYFAEEYPNVYEELINSELNKYKNVESYIFIEEDEVKEVKSNPTLMQRAINILNNL